MKKKIEGVTHITRGDVFDDLGFSRSEAAVLKVKADLLDAVLDEIDRRKYTPRELAQILDEYLPVVRDLLRGKTTKINMEKLVAYLSRLEMRVDLNVRATRKAAVRSREFSNSKSQPRPNLIRAETIALMADHGLDITRFFTGTGRMVRPVHSRNTD